MKTKQQLTDLIVQDVKDNYRASEKTIFEDIKTSLVKHLPEPNPDLPSVEELAVIINKAVDDFSQKWQSHEERSLGVSEYAQHLHSKYSLHPKQKEWWMRLKKGDKFLYDGFEETVVNIDITSPVIHTQKGGWVLVKDCTPYTPPTAQDIIAKHNLTEEEVRVIREGK